MRDSAVRPHPSHRLAAALALAAALGLGAHALAGELAVLHRVLAADSQPGAQQPCEAPPGLACAPGLGARPAAEPPAPTASRIGLEMTDCLTGCPTFTAVFSADGRFTYVGEANVERLGEHSGRVDAGRLRQVMRLAEEAGFASLDDTYASAFLDNPSTYVMLEWPQDVKVVRADGAAGPAAVWAIRELLLDLLEDAEWDR